MPYGIVERPSLALGSLQASLRRAGVACQTVYAHLEFARRVGLGAYQLIGTSDAKDLLGEWTFSRAAFGHQEADLQAYHREIYFDLFAHLGLTEQSLWDTLHQLRDQAEVLVDELALALHQRGARLVGCSSTFQQHCASLALQRRLKELDPGIFTLMGGANCEGPMGVALQRNCPWLDCVVSGEADLLIVDLVRALASREASPLPYGAISGPTAGTPPRASVSDLGKLPTPDYQDYFGALARSGLGGTVRPALPIETSRGCWWGAKHHCTFCGLNGSSMGFRVKTAERSLAEFEELSQQYDLTDFLVVDNILGMDSFKTLLPRLKHSDRDYRMFVETKANLKRSQVEALAEAGACWILPGLESLHDEILRLMDKGTTGITNLQTLKWCRELGIRVSWTLLCGFPGELDEWYDQMANWLPALEHLQPPSAVCPIGYHRFSPYHMRPQDFGVVHQPAPAYARVYPFADQELRDLAYFFVDAPGSCRSGQEGPGLQRVRRAVRAWALRFESAGLPAILSLIDHPERLEILDTRSQACRLRHSLTGTCRDLYLACESAPSRPSLARQLNVSEAELDLRLEPLLKDRLVLEQGGRLLALATRGDLPRLPTSAEFPGGFSHP